MRSPGFLLFVVLVGVQCSVAIAATEYPLDVLVQSAARMQNMDVTTKGVAANLEAVANPEVSFKYQYTLEMGGTQIRVLSNKQPIVNKLTKVTGTLRVVTSDGVESPVIEARSGLDLSDWRVWVLGLLIIAAVVLVVLLASPRRGPAVHQPEGPRLEPGVPGPGPGPGPISTMICPYCDASIPADSLRCDQCGQSLTGGSGGGLSSAPTVLPGSAPVSAGAQETVLIETPTEAPIADLTVRESGSSSVRVGEQFKLRTGKGRIGRDQGASIRLMDESVSREHAVIWWADGAFHIQDDASAAGTIVNGQKISGQTQLSNGDEIVLGRTTLVFRVI